MKKITVKGHVVVFDRFPNPAFHSPAYKVDVNLEIGLPTNLNMLLDDLIDFIQVQTYISDKKQSRRLKNS